MCPNPGEGRSRQEQERRDEAMKRAGGGSPNTKSVPAVVAHEPLWTIRSARGFASPSEKQLSRTSSRGSRNPRRSLLRHCPDRPLDAGRGAALGSRTGEEPGQAGESQGPAGQDGQLARRQAHARLHAFRGGCVSLLEILDSKGDGAPCGGDVSLHAIGCCGDHRAAVLPSSFRIAPREPLQGPSERDRG